MFNFISHRRWWVFSLAPVNKLSKVVFQVQAENVRIGERELGNVSARTRRPNMGSFTSARSHYLAFASIERKAGTCYILERCYLECFMKSRVTLFWEVGSVTRQK